MASDNIKLDAEVVAKELGNILEERDAVPPRHTISRVAGPTSGVTREFATNLAIAVGTVARGTETLGEKLSYFGKAAHDAIVELERANEISAETADRLAGLLGESGVDLPPAPSPASSDADTRAKTTGWA